MDIVFDEDESTPETASIDSADQAVDNVRSALVVSNTAPEVAAKNIERAKLFDLPPDRYSYFKEELDPEAHALERLPVGFQVGSLTQEYISSGEQQASLAQYDVEKLSRAERSVKNLVNKVALIPNKQREINELTSKKILAGGKLEDDEEEYLQELNAEIGTLSEQDFDLSGTEEFVTDTISAIGDFGRSFYEYKGVVATMIGGSAAAGAALGFATPVPGGAALGAKIGAAKALPAAMMTVGMLDGYTQMSRSLYNELTYNNFKPTLPLTVEGEFSQGTIVSDTLVNEEIPHDRRLRISQGVGLISGIASAASGGIIGKALGKTNPLLKRFINPKTAAKYITSNPKLLANMDILGGIAESALSEGGSEVASELARMIGENFAKMDESEASLTNAVYNIVTDAQKWKEAGYAGAIGAATGGVITGVPAIKGKKGLEASHAEAQEMIKRMESVKEKSDVMNTQEMLKSVVKELNDTKMSTLSPSEMGAFKKKLFSSLGDETVWFYMNDLKNFANTPEKGQIILNKLDPNGELARLASELNTPIEISKADVTDIMSEHPEIADLFRLTPEGRNPVEIKNDVDSFISQFEQAETQRSILLEKLEVDKEMTPELQEQLMEITERPFKENKLFESREGYQESSIIEPIPGLLTEKQAADLNQAQFNARMEVDNIVVKEVNERFKRYENYEVKETTAQDITRDIESLKREFDTIDSFDKTKDLTDVDLEYTKSHAKPGFSPYAIDPSTLSVAQRAIYFDKNDVTPSIKKHMKNRKAFVEGGLHVEEAALILGYETGDQLLRVLGETPTKKQIEARLKKDPLIETVKRQQINEANRETRLKAINEAFTNLTNVHLKEMQLLVNNDLPTAKRGIVKIGSPLPTVKDLNIQAKEGVKKLKVRDLSERRFKQGERLSQKAAMQDVVDGKWESAFENKRRAALNNEFRKEVVKAQDAVARAESFWKKMDKKSAKETMKEAGIDKVMDDFKRLYKLTGADKLKGERRAGERDAFLSWVKKQAAEGNVIGDIPERLSNSQMSHQDLTVEQYTAITDFAKELFNTAKRKNKVRGELEGQKDFRTQEVIAEGVDTHAREHANYDPKKAETKVDPTWWETKKKEFRTLSSMTESVKTIVMELDSYKPGGFFHKLIGEPIKRARNNFRQEIFDITTNDKEVIKKYFPNQKDFQNYFIERVNVPEFANIPELTNNGNIRKADLLVLQAYMGDPDGRKRMANFKDRQGKALSAEQVQTVLDRVLTAKDVEFVQEFLIDRWGKFKDRAAALEQRTKGYSPDMIEGAPFTHQGKEYRGGFYPIKYLPLTEQVKTENMLSRMADKDFWFGKEDESHFFAKNRAMESTYQGRLKDRQGSQRPLDIRFENFIEFTQQYVHDLNFREVGEDLMKVMKNPMNIENIKGVVGQEKFGVLYDGIKEVISSDKNNYSLYNRQNGFFDNVIQKMHSLHAVQAIGMNLTSVGIQADALPNLMMRGGPKMGLHLAETIARMSTDIATDPAKFGQYVELAQSINRDIKFEQDNIDNTVVKSSYDYIPNINFVKDYKTTKGLAGLKNIQKKAVDLSFLGVREADRVNKIVATISLSKAFIAGDIDGYPLSRIEKMTDAEKAKAMQSVVQQITDLSLTATAPEDKAALQKHRAADLFTRYWNDLRSRLNTVKAQANKTKAQGKKGEYGAMATTVATTVLATGIMRKWSELIRDEEESILNQARRVKDSESAANFLQDQAWSFIGAPVDQTLDSIPLVSAIKYSLGTETGRGTYRQVSFPALSVLDNHVKGTAVWIDILEMGIKGKRMKLDDRERKALITQAGYLVGGFPTNAINKGIDRLQERDAAQFGKSVFQELHDKINEYAEEYSDTPEAEAFIEDLRELQKTLPVTPTTDVKALIPENTKEVIKLATSKGAWDAYDPETGAAGIYQFTEERWNELAEAAPSLGLTENGRVSKDTSQQEKAMDYIIQENTRGLLTYEIPVTEENLLGTHKFGLENFIAIMESKDEDKLTTVLGKEVASRPEFKGLSTVKSLKRQLSRQTK